MDILRKRIVLTGAASGIGLALLEKFTRLPCQVLAVDSNADALASACSRLSGCQARLLPYVCDLSSRENIDLLFDRAKAVLGGIDLFMANAGFAYYEVLREPDWTHIEQIYRVNVFNPLYSIEKMQSLCGDSDYKVVVTASAMAQIAVPGYTLYSSTKAALERFADGYRWQMKDPRRLMLVYPIATRTGFFSTAGKGVPTPWPSQTPEQVAAGILDGIRRDRRTVFPSLTYRIVLFLKRFLPMHALVQWQEQRRLEEWLRRG